MSNVEVDAHEHCQRPELPHCPKHPDAWMPCPHEHAVAEEVANVNADADLGRPVRIVWIDSGLSVHNGWMDAKDLPAMVETVETVGLWMGENDSIVMVAGTRDSSNESWLHAQLIWKAAITAKEWLS